jgi:hypothetical protein
MKFTDKRGERITYINHCLLDQIGYALSANVEKELQQ